MYIRARVRIQARTRVAGGVGRGGGKVRGADGREARCFISNRGTLLKERDAFARRAARVHALSSAAAAAGRGRRQDE